jgi:hypothetical protein
VTALCAQERSNMNDYKQFDGSSNDRNATIKLARWLLDVLAKSSQDIAKLSSTGGDENEFEILLSSDYHPRFYQQLPDFIMALLLNDPKATIHYAPLLYHLAGCATCHSAYLELYDAMRYAVEVGDTLPNVNHGTRPLATIPAGTLVNLCQLLIRQAEAVLRQARHDRTDGDAQARSLLQWAMRVSAQITQSSQRAKALHDLVRVATFTDGPHSPGEQEEAVRSYSPLIGAGGPRGGRVLRKAGTPVRSTGTPAEQSIIVLQSSPLEGRITQHEDTLELHLQELDEKLRGHYLTISVPLGSLIEPVRWSGGNPRAIRTSAPVDKDGTVITPLGQTDLRLSNPEERNLLEVMFLLLEVRRVG